MSHLLLYELYTMVYTPNWLETVSGPASANVMPQAGNRHGARTY